jgi:ubiquinone/menaquinone biosynthesis C-methylase UbiE
MALTLRLRERFRDVKGDLAQAGLKPGQVVLDYGCGVGSYTLPAAEMVGADGLVYALDVEPLALKMAQERVARAGLSNVKTIQSERATGLPDDSLDVVLLYDVLHGIQDKSALLQELARVLKAGGILSVRPEHMAEGAFLEMMNGLGLFAFESQHGQCYQFTRQAGRS